MVRQPTPDVVGMELRLFEEGGHVVVIEPIFDLVVLSANGFHQPAISQEAELVGNSGLGDSGCEREVPHAHRPASQCIKDLGPSQVAQRLKGPDDQLQDLVWRERGSGIGDGGCIDGLRRSQHAFKITNLSVQMLR